MKKSLILFSFIMLLFFSTNSILKAEVEVDVDLLMINSQFSKDNSNYYFENNKIEDIDYQTAQVISSRIIKDKNGVYEPNCRQNICGKRKLDADQETFKYLAGATILGYDKNSIFGYDHCYTWSCTIIAIPADTSSIKMEGVYIITNDNIIVAANANSSGLPIIREFDDSLDISSFEEISDRYAKDKNNYYYSGFLIEEADFDTFQWLGASYAKDKNNYYHQSRVISYPVTLLKAMSYEVDSGVQDLGSDYFNVKNKIYYRDTLLDEVDPDSVKVYPSCRYFISDKDNIYLINNRELLDSKQIDSETFELSSGISSENSYKCLARDKDKYYAYNYWVVDDEIIEIVMDFASFEELDQGYLKDKNGIYFNYKRLDTVDQNSFEIVGKGVVKDKNVVYYRSKSGRDDTIEEHYKLEGADVDTFERIDEITFQDKNTKYYKKIAYWTLVTSLVKEADLDEYNNPPSNKLEDMDMGQGYALKSEKIYLNGKIIETVNIQTFDIIKFPYSFDGIKVFYFWDPIPVKVDNSSFEILNDDYSRDKNKIYYKNSVVEGVDIDSFKLNYNNDYQAEDKSNYYYKGKFLRVKAGEKVLQKKAGKLFKRLEGKIILKVEDNGKAYYLNPKTSIAHYLGRPHDAFKVMREQGLGISEESFSAFNGYAPANLAGRILLRVEAKGEAYYVNPENLKMHYLGRPIDAFNVMRELGLGISNENFNKL